MLWTLLLVALGITSAQTPCSGTVTTDPATGTVTVVCRPSVTPPIPPASTCSSTYCNPVSVLVVINDNMGPEAGTSGTNAGLYIAQHYMQARGIPAGNLVHTATFLERDHSGGSCTPGCDSMNITGDGEHISQTNFQAQIAAPIQAKITPAIHYVVMTYGTPYQLDTASGRISLDSALAGMLLASHAVGSANSYYNSDPASSPPHIDASTANVLAVTRLDGPDAAHAAALVDKALAGEQGIHGNGWFDYGPSAPLGATSLNAYTLCRSVVPAQNCILNDQSKTGAMIGPGNLAYPSAPMTAFAWGGYNAYDAGPLWNAYSFVPGAVGTSMNSNSAVTIHRPTPGTVVYWFLLNGVTATWGAVAEPGQQGYATGDNLLSHLWRGYTFGEAAYIASPWLIWQMIFLGDPLYRPTLKEGD